MKPSRLTCGIGLSLLLTACTTASLRPDTSALQTELATISPAARLPSNEGGADLAAPLTLERAVQVAFAHNPQVRAALARLEAIQAERVQAGLISNPMLSLMALRPEGGGRFQLEVGLMQSLYDVFARSRRVAVADAAARRREADVLSELVTLAQDTRSAVVQAWFAEQALVLEQQRLAVEVEAYLLTQRLAQQGVVSASDRLTQQAAVARQAHDVSVAESALATSRSELAGRLGLSSATGVTLPSELPTPKLANLQAPEWQAWAAQHRPELRVAHAQVEQAQAQRTANRGALRAAQPSAGVAGMRESDGMTLQGLALQITLPIFDTGQARKALADTQVAEAALQAEIVRRLVPLEVERALATVLIAQDAVAHTQQHLRQQQQLETLAGRTYQGGVGDRVGFREATRDRLMAAREHLQARQVLWTSLLELERAAARQMVTESAP